MGVMQSAAGSLDWLRTALGGEVAFEVLLAEAEAWEPGAEGLVFLPYLAGERTPHADSQARASFTGLTLRHTRGALVRAVLEGVCFGLRDCLDVLAQSGVTATAGIASGGGAAADLWLKIAASILDLPLSRTAVSDGAAFGAALLGGVATGAWADVHEAVQATVRITETTEPDPGWSRRYAELHRTFRALYPAIRHASDASDRSHPSKPAAQEVTQ
jgi:xylulokinase